MKGCKGEKRLDRGIDASPLKMEQVSDETSRNGKDGQTVSVPSESASRHRTPNSIKMTTNTAYLLNTWFADSEKSSVNEEQRRYFQDYQRYLCGRIEQQKDVEAKVKQLREKLKVRIKKYYELSFDKEVTEAAKVVCTELCEVGQEIDSVFGEEAKRK